MIKNAASKVMWLVKGMLWLGRGTATMLGLAVMMALVVGVASSALGATGGNFILGRNNVATAITALGGSLGVDGPMLRLINNNAGANDTALDLRVQAGEAPMRVNSDTKVTSLNADKLDGLDSTAFSSFGDSVFKYYFEIPTCREGEVASIPFSVSKASRVYASSTMSYSPNVTDGEGTRLSMDLYDAAGAKVASGGIQDSQTPIGTRSSLSMATVLRDASTLDLSKAPPFVAPPGKYTLKLTIFVSGSCSATGNTLSSGISLSYLLIGKP